MSLYLTLLVADMLWGKSVLKLEDNSCGLPDAIESRILTNLSH